MERIVKFRWDIFGKLSSIRKRQWGSALIFFEEAGTIHEEQINVDAVHRAVYSAIYSLDMLNSDDLAPRPLKIIENFTYGKLTESDKKLGIGPNAAIAASRMTEGWPNFYIGLINTSVILQ